MLARRLGLSAPLPSLGSAAQLSAYQQRQLLRRQRRRLALGFIIASSADGNTTLSNTAAANITVASIVTPSGSVVNSAVLQAAPNASVAAIQNIVLPIPSGVPVTFTLAFNVTSLHYVEYPSGNGRRLLATSSADSPSQVNASTCETSYQLGCPVTNGGKTGGMSRPTRRLLQLFSNATSSSTSAFADCQETECYHLRLYATLTLPASNATTANITIQIAAVGGLSVTAVTLQAEHAVV